MGTQPQRLENPAGQQGAHQGFLPLLLELAPVGGDCGARLLEHARQHLGRQGQGTGGLDPVGHDQLGHGAMDSQVWTIAGDHPASTAHGPLDQLLEGHKAPTSQGPGGQEALGEGELPPGEGDSQHAGLAELFAAPAGQAVGQLIEGGQSRCRRGAGAASGDQLDVDLVYPARAGQPVLVGVDQRGEADGALAGQHAADVQTEARACRRQADPAAQRPHLVALALARLEPGPGQAAAAPAQEHSEAAHRGLLGGISGLRSERVIHHPGRKR